jgi:hypothetical protein
LFEEFGALESVAQLAVQWFSKHLAPAGKTCLPNVNRRFDAFAGFLL